MNAPTESQNQLHGKWLLIARLAWAAVFAMLTAMYLLGFIAVHDILSTVCEDERCTLRQQIRHTASGDEMVGYPGPPIGYADRLRPDQVEALQTLGLTLDRYGWLAALQMGIPALAYLLIAAGLFWQKSDNWMVLLVSMTIALFPLQNMPLPLTLTVQRPVWGWLVDLGMMMALSSFLILPLIFPTGRFVPRWTRWKVVFDIICAIMVILFRNSVAENTYRSNLLVSYLLFSLGIGVYAQLYRYFRMAKPVERQQIKWVNAGLAGFVSIAMLVLIPLDSLLASRVHSTNLARALVLSAIPDTLFWVISFFIPVSIAISVLRYRLWDVDIIISRALVYGTLTAIIAALYVLIVGLSSIGLQTQNILAGRVLALLVIAFLFQPLRQRMQRMVDRFVPVPQSTQIGEKNKPQTAIPEGHNSANTMLRGRWLSIARLAWISAFTVLTIMYALGFVEVHTTLSTVCDEEPCTLRKQIQHTEAGDRIMSYLGPPTGYADRLRPDQVKVLETLGLTLDQYSWLGALQMGIPALIFLLIAAGLFWRKSDNWMALFVSIMIATTPLWEMPLPFTLAVRQPAWGGVVALAFFVSQSFNQISPLVFPTGRFVPRWTRWMLIFIFVNAFFLSFYRPLIEHPYVDDFVAVTIVISASIALYAQVYRYFRVANPLERQQLKWILVGQAGFLFTAILVLLPLNELLVSRPGSMDPARVLLLSAMIDTLYHAMTLFGPVAIVISILRYRLWDVDILISRTLVYGTLSAGIMVTYILLIGLFSELLNTHVALAAGLVTAALTIPFFQPLRLRLQRAVNRITLGGRKSQSAKQEIEELSAELEMPFSHRSASLLFGFTCVLSAVSIAFLALSWSAPVPDTWGFRGDALLFALSFSSIGLLLARHHPQNSIGWLLLVAGSLSAFLEFCIDYAAYTLLTKPGALPGGTVAAWTSSWVWVIAIAMLIYTFLLFPTGQLPSAGWRPVAWFVMGAFILTTITFMIQPGPLYFAPYLDNPFSVQPLYRALYPLQILSAVAILLIGLSVILRLRRAEGVERQQLKWFAYTAILITMIGITDSLAGAAGLIGRDPKLYQYLTVAIWIAIPFAIAFAIQRYRLWDIDLIINRTLVYGTLTAGIVGLYIILVGALSLLSQTTGNLVISLLATGLIAFLFQPLRERLQRWVNRLIYGERDDPYAALSRLGRRLEASLAPEAVLPTVVTTVRDVLRLPYVAIYLKHEDGNKIAVESASPALRSENGRIRVPGIEREGLCVPLIHQGETLGYIVLGPRAPNEAFSATDLRLLDDLAPQVGVAVHAVRLTADLQRSRERLVLAREEERRRLRRDLHDDLGPTLASFGLTASTVADLIPNNPAAATKLVKELEAQMRATVGNVRKLVYDLRPPTLDELGLLPAVRERATRFSNAPNGFHVTVDAPDELPALPAAVEVAAYRIVQEALENVSKHAQARQCAIRFVDHNGLEIEIIDDGIGLPTNITPGVGLRSMRERAEELGGSCVIERCTDGGTRILTHLPIGEFNGTFAYPDRG